MGRGRFQTMRAILGVVLVFGCSCSKPEGARLVDDTEEAGRLKRELRQAKSDRPNIGKPTMDKSDSLDPMYGAYGPSVFDASALGGIGIITHLDACEEGTAKNGVVNGAYAAHYCGCMTDAFRVEFTKRITGASNKLGEPTEGDRRKCHSYARKQDSGKFGAGAAPSLFSSKRLGTASISAAFVECSASIEAKSPQMSFTQMIGTCTCLSDATRHAYLELGQGKLLEATLKGDIDKAIGRERLAVCVDFAKKYTGM